MNETTPVGEEVVEPTEETKRDPIIASYIIEVTIRGVDLQALTIKDIEETVKLGIEDEYLDEETEPTVTVSARRTDK